MNQLWDFFNKLFDSSDWPPRWHCGHWTEFHGWLYIISDLLIWSAYFSIPVVIIRYITKKQGVAFVKLYFLFAAFILACGATHFLDAIMFWVPVYRLSALVRLITGVLSWITVFYLVKLLPMAFSSKTQTELETEIAQRIKAEEQVRLLNAKLEQYISDRTEELSKSNKEIEDYKYALDQSSIVAITSQQGTITHVNENFCRISKYNAGELIGQDHRIINSGHHSKDFIRGLWVTIANGEIWRGELKNKAKDGSIYWVDTTIVPFLDEKGKPYQYVAIRADITERKQATEALNESQQLLMAIIDNSAAVIYVKDMEGRYLLINRRFCDLFHVSKQEVLQKTDYDIFPVTAADAFRVMDKRVAASAVTLKEEETAPHDDGIHTYISVKSVLCDVSGNPYGVFGISTDITELKAVEANLRKSIREISDYKFALDESSIIAITDQKGIIRHVNDNFCKISKYHAVELLGQDHRIINSGYHTKEFIRGLWHTIAKGKIWKGELKNKAKDGSHYWVDTTIVPFLDERGKPYQYVAIRADITARKQAEEELYKLNEELESRVNLRTVQLEAANTEMEAFTYSVSHDLRAPLRGIIGFSAILEEDYGPKLDEEAKRIITVIKSNTLKMGQLIDDLLAFSRMGRQDMLKTRVDTQLMVKEIINELCPGNKHQGIDWEVHVLPPINADINTIRQVWINLLSNAIKYSGKKEKAHIEIGSFVREAQTAFFIRDNGIGFDNRYKDKLFKVFQRLHSPTHFEGTGVGLALVAKIISKHGGKVWAEGEVDKGACFYFSVPAN